MYEMLFAEKPFNSSRMPKLHYVNTLRRRVEVRFPMFESNFVSPCCLALIRNLLSYDKQNRLSGEDLVKHPFLDIEYVKDEQSHYMKACECLVSGVELVNSQKLGAGYIDTTEAILHLKIHINRIHDDEALLKYTMSRYNEYTKYCEQIEDRLLSDRNSGPICMQSQIDARAGERLRYVFRGEMYFVQCNRQKGAEMIKQGLDVLFPLLVHEPDGLRKHLLASKIDQWMKMLEKLKRDQAFIVRR
ncbi:hypothetical protein NQ318_009364 [Aromia moschata]|uniref:Protein kinase domain-containing protein n=1 Tax=Aromia moschata TaxID=1265417 RepID=A0AAV8XE05_9CUCU|nr:hypothetical protein NQ318_009364 [Aromia moschata]